MAHDENGPDDPRGGTGDEAPKGAPEGSATAAEPDMGTPDWGAGTPDPGEAAAPGSMPPPQTPPQAPAPGSPPPGPMPPTGGQYGQPSGYAGPQPLSPQDEKTWAVLAHASPFVTSIIGLPFLGPLLVYLVFRDRGPFVRHHAAQALNFQLIVMIGIIISIPLVFIVIGIFTLIAISIGAVVLMIIAIVETANGKWYRYPLTPDWVR